MRSVVMVMAAGLLLFACRGAASPPDSTANPDGNSSAMAAPSPSPTYERKLAGAFTLEPAGNVKLPVDEQGYWFPLDLLQGTHTFLLEHAVKTPDEAAKGIARLALFDADTGALQEFRSLEPGHQVVGYGNDGRFLVWEEGGIMGINYDGWRMYARDLATGDTWPVDIDPALLGLPGEAGLGVPLTVDHGRLVYSTFGLDSDGRAVPELKMVDLQARKSTVLLKLEGDALDKGFSTVSLSGDTLIWLQVSQTPDASNRIPTELDLMNLSSGETRTLVQGYMEWPVVGQGKVLYTTDPGQAALHLMDLSTGEDKMIWGPFQEQTPLLLAPGYALWIERLSYTAMAYDTVSNQLVGISGPYVQSLFVSGRRVYWSWETEESMNGRSAEPELYLKWADLPAP